MCVPDSSRVWWEDHLGHLHHALPHRLPHERRRWHPPDWQDPNHKYIIIVQYIFPFPISCDWESIWYYFQLQMFFFAEGQYYFILLVFTTFATVMAVIILKLHHRFHYIASVHIVHIVAPLHDKALHGWLSIQPMFIEMLRLYWQSIPFQFRGDRGSPMSPRLRVFAR